MLRIELSTRRRTLRLGEQLARTARRGDLLVLCGELGAGKTFLARALARGLGVAREVRITSPTFTLVHQYDGKALQLVHADLYRVRGVEGLVELGLEELRAEGALLVVEWGEPFVEALGGDALVLRLAICEKGRSACLEAQGSRSREWLTELEVLQAAVRTKEKRE